MSSTPSSSGVPRGRQPSTSQGIGSSEMRARNAESLSISSALHLSTTTSNSRKNLGEKTTKSLGARSKQSRRCSRSRSRSKGGGNQDGSLGVRSESTKRLLCRRSSSERSTKTRPVLSTRSRVPREAIQITAEKMFAERLHSDANSLPRHLVQNTQSVADSSMSLAVERGRANMGPDIAVNPLTSTLRANLGVSLNANASPREDSNVNAYPLPKLQQAGSREAEEPLSARLSVLPNAERIDPAPLQRYFSSQGRFQASTKFHDSTDPTVSRTVPIQQPVDESVDATRPKSSENMIVQPAAAALLLLYNAGRQNLNVSQDPVLSAQNGEFEQKAVAHNRFPVFKGNHLAFLVASDLPVNEQLLNVPSEYRVETNGAGRSKSMEATDEETLAIKREKNKFSARRYRGKKKRLEQAEREEVQELRNKLKRLQIMTSKLLPLGKPNETTMFNRFRHEALQSAFSIDPRKSSASYPWSVAKGKGMLRRELLIAADGLILQAKGLEVEVENIAGGFVQQNYWEGMKNDDILTLKPNVSCVVQLRQQFVFAYRRKVVNIQTQAVKIGEFIPVKGFFYPIVEQESVNKIMLLEFVCPLENCSGSL